MIFCENKVLYDSKGPVSEGEYVIPLGKADVKRAGSDVTIVAISRMVIHALQAADELAKAGINAEVVDLRSLAPLDEETVLASLRKTGRLVVDEDNPRCSVAGDIATLAATQALEYLNAPVKLVTAPHTPVPFSPAADRVWRRRPPGAGGRGAQPGAHAGAGCRLEVIPGMGHFSWVLPSSPGFKHVAELTVSFLQAALPV